MERLKVVLGMTQTHVNQHGESLIYDHREKPAQLTMAMHLELLAALYFSRRVGRLRHSDAGQKAYNVVVGPSGIWVPDLILSTDEIAWLAGAVDVAQSAAVAA